MGEILREIGPLFPACYWLCSVQVASIVVYGKLAVAIKSLRLYMILTPLKEQKKQTRMKVQKELNKIFNGM